MAEVEEEASSKGGLIKTILIVLIVLLVAVGSALGALFFTGFFDEKEADAAEEAIAELEAEIQGTDAMQMPETVSKDVVEEEKFKPTYKDFPQPFVANIVGSRKVMQVTLAVMTYYGEKSPQRSMSMNLPSAPPCWIDCDSSARQSCGKRISAVTCRRSWP